MASGLSEVTESVQVQSVKSRVILQQCLSAKLMVQPKTDTQDEEYVEVNVKKNVCLRHCMIVEVISLIC